MRNESHKVITHPASDDCRAWPKPWSRFYLRQQHHRNGVFRF